MADMRQKIKAISSANGASAPELSKRLGMGFLFAVLAAVSILTFIIAIGLFKSGSLLMGTIFTAFLLLTLLTAAAAFPLKRNTW